MTSRERISVLLPTYNGALYLREALSGIASQEEQDIEVILVDDGSTDDTVAIARSFLNKLDLRIIEGSHAGNWVANSNRALDLASGELISCLHQDDYWHSGRIRKLRDVFAKSPDVDFVFHPARFVGPGGRPLGTWTSPLPPFPEVLDAGYVLPRLLVQNFISMPSPVFRRSTAIALGGFDEKLWYAADWDLWLKLAFTGKTIYLPELLASFRVHPLSQTMQRASPQEIRSQLEEVFFRHWTRWHASASEKNRVRRIGELSIELNVLLAGRGKGLLRQLVGVLGAGLRVPPTRWPGFFRDTRIWQRLKSRVRAFARAPGHPIS